MIPGWSVRQLFRSSRQMRRSCSASAIKQAQALLNAPDANTTKRLWDRAILALLLAADSGVPEWRRSPSTTSNRQDGRRCFVDLVGKHGRVGCRHPLVTGDMGIYRQEWRSRVPVAVSIILRMGDYTPRR